MRPSWAGILAKRTRVTVGKLPVASNTSAGKVKGAIIEGPTSVVTSESDAPCHDQSKRLSQTYERTECCGILCQDILSNRHESVNDHGERELFQQHRCVFFIDSKSPSERARFVLGHDRSSCSTWRHQDISCRPTENLKRNVASKLTVNWLYSTLTYN